MAVTRRADGTVTRGSVLNPKGVSGWTRRKEVEQLWQQLLAEAGEGGKSRVQVILDRLIVEAEQGKSWAVTAVLDRILPPISKQEIEATVAPKDPAEIALKLDRLLTEAEERAQLAVEAEPTLLGDGGNGAESPK